MKIIVIINKTIHDRKVTNVKHTHTHTHTHTDRASTHTHETELVQILLPQKSFKKVLKDERDGV